MMLFSTTVVAIISCFIGGADGQYVYLLGGSPVLPGFQARLTRHFFDLLNDVGTNVIDEILGGKRPLKFPSFEKKVPGGTLNVKDLQINYYKNNKPYILEMSAPYSIKVGIQDADVTVNSRYDFTPGFGSLGAGIVDRFINPSALEKVIPRSAVATGGAKMTAKGLSVKTTSLIDKTKEGGISIEVKQCETKFEDFKLEVNPDAGTDIPGFSGTTRSSLLSRATRPLFEKEICNEIKKIIDGSLSDQMSQWGYKIKLADLETAFTAKDDPAKDQAKEQEEVKKELRDMIYNQIKDFELDLTLLERPLLLGVKPYDFLDSKHKAEISLKGRGGTPFHPHAMVPPIFFDRMFIGSISDYTFNSFLYGLYKQRKSGLIKTVISPETMPSQAKRLKTTCDNVFCVGDFFENIGEKHPDKDVEIVLEPIEQPYFIIFPGYIKGEITERITMNVYTPGWSKSDMQTVMKGNLTVKPEARLVVQDDKIHGNVDLKDFQMPLAYEGKTSNEFADILKLLMEDEINTRLQAGVTVPKIHAATLQNIQLDFLWRTIKIKSDVKVDTEKLSDMVYDAINKMNTKTTGFVWRGSETR